MLIFCLFLLPSGSDIGLFQPFDLQLPDFVSTKCLASYLEGSCITHNMSVSRHGGDRPSATGDLSSKYPVVSETFILYLPKALMPEVCNSVIL